jgi:hypothetical protein
MIADGFTKLILVDKYTKFVNSLSLVAKPIPWKKYEYKEEKYYGNLD